MTATSLTDRYVAAAMRTVPEKQRDDLAAELRASIDDQVDARVDDGEPHGDAERAVLTELGDPDKLAAGYTDRPLYLIGPRYYLDWWRLLKLLLWIVLPCAAFGVALGKTLAGDGIGEIVGTVVVTLISVVVHLVFWTTAGVRGRRAHRRRSRQDTSPTWTVDQLPEPTANGRGLRRHDRDARVPRDRRGRDHLGPHDRLRPGYVTSEDAPLSFLNPGLWPWWIAGLFVLMALEAILAVVVYLVGRWTPLLAVFNAVLALAVAIPAIILLADGQLLNPEYFPTVIPDDGEKVAGIVGVITGFVIAGIALWDIIDVILKAVRARR